MGLLPFLYNFIQKYLRAISQPDLGILVRPEKPSRNSPKISELESAWKYPMQNRTKNLQVLSIRSKILLSERIEKTGQHTQPNKN